MKSPKHLPKPVRKSGGARATKLSDQMAGSTIEFAASQAAHFDNYSVEQFAYAMRIKLAVKRNEGRGGWQDKALCSAEFLSQLLREHVEKGDPVDVANFCMMLHQRGEQITPSPETHVVGIEEGIERAARYIEKQRDEYVQEYGMYDGTTGVTEYSKGGEEYLSTLEELIDGIRALDTTEGQP